jgi:exonuclease VII small subunit
MTNWQNIVESLAHADSTLQGARAQLANARQGGAEPDAETTDELIREFGDAADTIQSCVTDLEAHLSSLDAADGDGDG